MDDLPQSHNVDRTADSTRRRPLRPAVIWCVPAGAVAYEFALLMVISIVPRHRDGIRECVSIPWAVLATLPWATAAVLSGGIVLLVVRGRQMRFAALLLLLITIAFCNTLTVDLLRRDYVGKF